MSTLWHGRFEGGPADELMAFTVSLPFDRRLAADDLDGSRAHVRGLVRVGLLDDAEARPTCWRPSTRSAAELADGALRLRPTPTRTSTPPSSAA